MVFEVKGQKVSSLGGAMQNKDGVNRPCFACISNQLNREECRSHILLLSNKFKTAKRGFLSLEISA